MKVIDFGPPETSGFRHLFYIFCGSPPGSPDFSADSRRILVSVHLVDDLYDEKVAKGAETAWWNPKIYPVDPKSRPEGSEKGESWSQIDSIYETNVVKKGAKVVSKLTMCWSLAGGWPKAARENWFGG